MKKLILILTAVIMSLSLTSCITEAYAQVDDAYDNVDISLVVTYGTPYYNADGLLLYYMYRNLYYYPYYHYNRYYLHRYYRPIPLYLRDRYRPVPRDSYRNYYRHHTPRHNYNGRPNVNNNRPHYGTTPNMNRRGISFGNGINNARPNMNANRPNVGSIPRIAPSNQGVRGGNSTFGGRR